MAFSDDKKTLIQVLEFIDKVLEELLKHITEDNELFESAWHKEVQPGLRSLIASINDIPNAASPRWTEFERRGLAGEQLKLKRARLAAVSKKGILKKILDVINTLLGSIPGADPVREFKELTEESLEDNPSASVKARFA